MTNKALTAAEQCAALQAELERAYGERKPVWRRDIDAAPEGCFTDDNEEHRTTYARNGSVAG